MVIDSRRCEFGSELILVVSKVYSEKKKNSDVGVITSSLMKPFYFFLDESKIDEKYTKRAPGSPWGNLHSPTLPKDFDYPDFKNHYKKFKLPFDTDKEIILISNKYNMEWSKPPINFLNIDTLREIFTILSKKYLIVYNRVKPEKIIEDNSKMLDLDDYELVNEFENVIDINNITSNYTINELQLIIGAHSNHKISVQGGTSILSSLTGGENNIFVVKGGELKHNTYEKWYNQLSNCKIKTHNTYESLVNRIKEIVNE